MGSITAMADLAWMAAGGATCLSLLLVARTALLRQRRVRDQGRNSQVWMDTHAAGERMVMGMGKPGDHDTISKNLGKARSRASAIGAMVAVIRSHGGQADRELLDAVEASGIDRYLRSEFLADDPHRRAAALEIVEATRREELTGDVAALAVDPEPDVVRAAANALVVLKPELAVGVLVGLLADHGPWVVDSLGRAANTLSVRDNRNVPIARPYWRDAPDLARRALSQGLLTEPGDASDAVAVMISLLDSDDTEKRLGAVNALADIITHPGAQIALAGAMGADDRVTRFAAAVRLADSDEGQRLLRNAVSGDNASDAAEVAALVLWGEREVVELT